MAHPVTPVYFTMLGAPLRYGRDFVAADSRVEPSAAVINVHTAMEVFGTENPVGRTLVLGEEELTVIGVVDGVQHFGLSRDIGLAVYVPSERFGGFLPMLHVGVRSQADFETVVTGMREAVWGLKPDLPIQDITTMRQRVSDSLATRHRARIHCRRCGRGRVKVVQALGWLAGATVVRKRPAGGGSRHWRRFRVAAR